MGKHTIEELYPRPESARRRIAALTHRHRREFDAPAGASLRVYSAPGRTELGGNHTDHNNGRVIASSVHLDSLAVVTPRDTGMIRLNSEGFAETFEVSLDDLEPSADEHGSSAALIRGVAAGIASAGGRIGGFDCNVESRVLPGSGLSSSASFEVLVATILNDLYNDGELSTVQLAKISQSAENDFFGKPCGLMDQLACITGGIVAIDFADPVAPDVGALSYSFHEHDLELLVVDTGGNHADLTADYAAVTEEMQSVAGYFGLERLRGLTTDELMQNICGLRKQTNDRAILRALHFLNENERVTAMVAALRQDDIAEYLRLVTESGDSSWRLLQNCFTPKEPHDQGVTLAIAVTRQFLDSNGLPGACRVHGGGFAGTIQAYVPHEAVQDYTELIEGVFDRGVVTPLTVRSVGAVRIDAD